MTDLTKLCFVLMMEHLEYILIKMMSIQMCVL